MLRVTSPYLSPSSLPLHAACVSSIESSGHFFLLSKLCKSCFPSSHSLSHVHPCSAVSFFQIIKKKKRKRWLNSSNPFLASHFLSVNQGESFLTFLSCCEGQMFSCEYKGFIHGYLWPRSLGSSPTCLTEIQFQPLPCCVSFSKLLTFSVPQFPKWKMEIIKVRKSWGCLLMVTWDNSCVLWSQYMLKTASVLSPQQVLALFWAPSRC